MWSPGNIPELCRHQDSEIPQSTSGDGQPTCHLRQGRQQQDGAEPAGGQEPGVRGHRGLVTVPGYVGLVSAQLSPLPPALPRRHVHVSDHVSGGGEHAGPGRLHV